MAAPSGHLSQSGAQVRQPVAAVSSESGQSSDSGSSGSSAAASSGSSEGNGSPRSSASASGSSSEGSLSAGLSDGGSTGGALSLPSTPDGTIGLGDVGTGGATAMTPASLPSSITDAQSGINPASGSGLTAHYTGTLTNMNLWVGTFGLDANVASGQVSNAALNVTGSQAFNFTAANGSGTIDGSKKFSMNNFTMTSSTIPQMVTHGSAWMNGKFTGPGDSQVKGTWGSEMGGIPIHTNGKFDGTVAP